MATFKSIFKKLDVFAAKIKSEAHKLLSGKTSRLLLGELKAHSPEDTGLYKSNWRVSTPRFGGKNALAGIRIVNKTKYAGYMEFGAQPQQAPWYFPGRDKKGQMKSGTGKLTLATGRWQGRVWAGGLSPGHDKTIGGAIAAVRKKYDNFSGLKREFANAVLKGWS